MISTLASAAPSQMRPHPQLAALVNPAGDLLLFPAAENQSPLRTTQGFFRDIPTTPPHPGVP